MLMKTSKLFSILSTFIFEIKTQGLAHEPHAKAAILTDNHKHPEPSLDLPEQSMPLFIPRIFHSVWMDFGKGAQVPKKYVENREKLMNLHPDWKIINWTEKSVTKLIKQSYPYFLETFLSYDKPIKRHDACRAVILHHYGGVYLDHDFYPIRNIEPLLKSYKFVVGREMSTTDTGLANGLMACVKEFKMMKLYIQCMNNPDAAKKHVLKATGPQMLQKVFKMFCVKYGSESMKIYDFPFFYNYLGDLLKNPDFTEEELKSKYPLCYLIHTYDSSWRNQ